VIQSLKLWITECQAHRPATELGRVQPGNLCWRQIHLREAVWMQATGRFHAAHAESGRSCNVKTGQCFPTCMQSTACRFLEMLSGRSGLLSLIDPHSNAI